MGFFAWRTWWHLAVLCVSDTSHPRSRPAYDATTTTTKERIDSPSVGLEVRKLTRDISRAPSPLIFTQIRRYGGEYFDAILYFTQRVSRDFSLSAMEASRSHVARSVRSRCVIDRPTDIANFEGYHNRPVIYARVVAVDIASIFKNDGGIGRSLAYKLESSLATTSRSASNTRGSSNIPVARLFF